MALDFDALALDQPATAATGAPLMLLTEAIEEDPSQPRREFDAEALQQLADTITERGVRQPISVRAHPHRPGRWLLNFGARRLRASKLAGKAEIPAFIDETADSYDQVIENEQREGLKPLELALFVQKRLAAGDSQADIARRLGKSRTFVTYATALIDAPDWLMTAYREGRCRGARELHELRGLHAAHPQPVQEWLKVAEPITRERIAALKAGLALPTAAPQDVSPTATAIPDSTRSRLTRGPEPRPAVRSEPQSRSGQGHFLLHADLDGQIVEVTMNQLPKRDGDVHVQLMSGGTGFDVAAVKLRLLRVVAR